MNDATQPTPDGPGVMAWPDLSAGPAWHRTGPGGIHPMASLMVAWALSAALLVLAMLR